MSYIYTMRQTYKSFALTIRPRLGISDTTIESYLSWLRKQAYAVAVIEMADEARHLHAQIWLEEGRTKDDVAKQVKRICERTIEDWDAGQSKVLRGGIRIAYSDWYLEYLTDNENKQEEANVLLHNPPDKTESYYPTEEEQENVKALSQSADPRFLKMEQECLEYLGKNQYQLTQVNIARYLSAAMFEYRTMKVLIQQRDRTALCKTLFAYMSKGDINLFIDKTKEEKKIDEKFENLKKYVSENYHSDSDDD